MGREQVAWDENEVAWDERKSRGTRGSRVGHIAWDEQPSRPR